MNTPARSGPSGRKFHASVANAASARSYSTPAEQISRSWSRKQSNHG
jgi:hypothetical protein